MAHPVVYFEIMSPQAPGSITGGIGQTANGYSAHVMFESLGGKRILNPSKVPDMQIEIAPFSDPEGNTVGLVNTGKM